ncbi:MAG: hypothetical protein L0Z53_08395 [Acidobacteriales bacterium]|nr:hypothetical protein [Terriglobales bacterium]
MPQRIAIAELSRKYRVVEEDGAWLVWSGDGASATMVGAVRFQEGKLNHVSNNLYTRVAGDPDFPRTLHRTIEDFVRGGQNPGLVQTASNETSEGKGNTIFIKCNQHTLKISIVVLTAGREFVSISEEVGSQK